MRTVVALLLLALWAEAEDMVVRVTVDDEPLGDAAVQVQPVGDVGPTFRADRFAPDARTDATGQALVQATAEDWILVYVPGYELAVVQGGGRIVDVALRPERVFSGRVVDTGGEPIVGASVRLRTTFRRKAGFSALSGEKGNFHVYGLWFDNYSLRIEAAGFLAWPFGSDLTERDSGRTIVLERPAGIAGTVTDHRGEAVVGAEVRVIMGGSTKTADDGTYRFTGLEPGVDYRIAFPPPWGGQAGPFTVDEGEVREGIDVVRLAPVTLRLRLVDADGQGIEGITARPVDLDLEAVASDAEGAIELLLPPERDGSLWLMTREHENTTVEFERSRPGATQDLGDVFLRVLPEIEVRVRLPDGTSPADCTVGSVPLVDGIARVKGAAEYNIAARGYPLMFWPVEPPGPVIVTLPELQWIDGIVVDANGGPVASAQVDTPFEDVDPVRTDGEGRFRVGPFAEGPVQVGARTATARSRSVEVVLGGGELELTVVATKPDLLRGRVLRGIRPVRRFTIEGTAVVDEEGRFEVLVSRADKDWVEVGIYRTRFPFRLPPEGRELIARLPGGRVAVALEGAGPDEIVSLAPVGGIDGDLSETGQDGVARFADLEPGVYAAEAGGFATTEFMLVVGADQLVTLPATPQGTLTVRAPSGFKFSDELHQTLNPGVHRDVLVGVGAYRIFLAAVRIVPGEETIVDLAPSDGGSLLIRGPPGTGVDLELRRADATLRFVAQLEEEGGAFRFPMLPPGSYAVRTPLRRVAVDIAPGDAAVLELGTGAHAVTDRVLLWNGKPAQGAEVELFPADDEDRKRSVLTDLRGRFRFANVLPGQYTCVARLQGHAPARATVTVAIDGIETEGLPMALERSAGKHARLVGLAGERLRHVPVRVDGRWQATDALGRLTLHRVPSRIDLDLEGFASLRNLDVQAGDEISMVRGATLVVLTDLEAGPPVVRVNGRPWRRLSLGPLADDPEPGRLRLEDLPVGPVEIQLPRPVAERVEEAAETPEPVVATLEPGTVTIVDLREG